MADEQAAPEAPVRPAAVGAGCRLGLAEHLRTPELVFGIVRTVGTEIAPVLQELHAALAAANYLVFRVDLDALLTPLAFGPEGAAATPPSDEPTRRELLMDAGDRLRHELGRADAVALVGIREIHRVRGDAGADHARPRAFILDNLSHRAEVETVRQVYGRRAFFIACDAPRPERALLLAQLFERSSGLDASAAEQAATHAVDRDFGLATSRATPPVPRRLRLSSSAALERCDLFVRCDDPTQTRRHVRRLVECIHSHPFHTLTMDELGMAAAYRGSLTTAVLARRVGTAIMVDDQIVAVGANEVPKAGGGYYHTESQPDGREFMAGLDASDGIRAQILADLLARLRPGWFTPELRGRTIAELTQLAINDDDIRDADLFDVIEYGRTTHAEMVAITSAARRGIAIQGGTLYSTTLPCHECTRNIIASGLARVVYLEPYHKSKGGELHRDAVDLFPEPVSPRAEYGPTARADRVSFEPFSGFSHHRLSDLFSWVPRKADDVRRANGEPIRLDGRAVIWRAHEAALRPSISDPAFAETDGLTRLVTEMRVLAALPDPRPRAACAPLADLETLLDRIEATLDGGT
ncbi:CMP deaminase [Frankia sp. CNm7]|uniref:CMP deaminase n=1 Tax=Frankia nepalensis TaxID=1836974 RepID=A0A937UR21_9ACTN|nr:deaminase [Frankia nepalensis]MBL7498499.1 CMP deaminase [Frankia nepalensis]MBL7509647.1 CMP deaminase [Frankia nepalensis]MBL7524537.1 CMP deaminase [Frankia nepalensis]MBL7630857.1 CMP deaminase [Frankia nepalensis]